MEYCYGKCWEVMHNIVVGSVGRLCIILLWEVLGGYGIFLWEVLEGYGILLRKVLGGYGILLWEVLGG